MHVGLLDPADREAYDALALAQGTLFQSPAWLDLFDDRLQRYVIRDRGDALRGGFCLYRERRLGATFVRNPPFTPHCGPFLAVRSSNPVARVEERRRSLTAMAEHLDGLRCPLLSIRLDPRVDDLLPFMWRRFRVAPAYTYLLDLARPLDAIKQGMSPARRNDIAKATRDGVEVVPVTELGLVRPLIVATFERKAKDAREEVLDRILGFVGKGHGFALASMRRGKAIACCVIVHDNRSAYYLLGGYDPADRHHGAGALALFEAIGRAREMGLTVFDFEGSVIPEVEKFFCGFGGRLSPYFSVSKAWLPLDVALKLARRDVGGV